MCSCVTIFVCVKERGNKRGQGEKKRGEKCLYFNKTTTLVLSSATQWEAVNC